jgi:hypothetical protein
VEERAVDEDAGEEASEMIDVQFGYDSTGEGMVADEKI